MADDDILDIEHLDALTGEENGIPIKIVSPGKFAILSIASFGLFEVWWMYRTWTFYRYRDAADVWPVTRAILGVLFFYNLILKIKFDARKWKWEGNYHAGFMTLVYVGFTLCTKLPDPLFNLSFFSLIAFLLPLRAFNHYIQTSPDYQAIANKEFILTDYLILGIGSVLWFSVFLASFVEDI